MHQELNKNLGKKEWGKMHEQQHKEGKMPQSRPLEVGLISRAGSLRLPVSHTHTHPEQCSLRPGKQHSSSWSSFLSNLNLIAVGPLCATSEI